MGREYSLTMTARVTRVVDAAGAVPLAMGLALTLSPSRTAQLVGLGDQPALARRLGLADLALAPSLLRRGRRRTIPMAARAALNIVIGVAYSREARAPDGHSRARQGAVAMAVLTVVDGAAAIALHRADG